MKKKGHPPYQDVLFIDTATGTKFVCGTTLQPNATEMYEGKKYPVYYVPTSSASHPFFTGSQQFVDSEGRVSKFQKRYLKKPLANEAKETKQMSSIKKTSKQANRKKKKDAK